MSNVHLCICVGGKFKSCHMDKQCLRKTRSSYEEKAYISLIKEMLRRRKDEVETMNPQGIIKRLNCCTLELNKGNVELKKLGVKKAQAEKAYKVKQAEEILKLKSEKYPATLIMELVKGNEEVAELRLQRDVAESAYNACINAIVNLRIEIDAIRSKLKLYREGLI